MTFLVIVKSTGLRDTQEVRKAHFEGVPVRACPEMTDRWDSH